MEISFWAIQKFQTDIACLKLSEYLPSSVVEFVLPHHIASLIRGGAKAGPWRNEELCPSGTPSKDDEATTPPTARKSSPFEREKVVICSIKNNSYNNMIIVKLTAIKKEKSPCEMYSSKIYYNYYIISFQKGKHGKISCMQLHQSASGGTLGKIPSFHAIITALASSNIHLIISS